jgi:hypothetical protein
MDARQPTILCTLILLLDVLMTCLSTTKQGQVATQHGCVHMWWSLRRRGPRLILFISVATILLLFVAIQPTDDHHAIATAVEQYAQERVGGRGDEGGDALSPANIKRETADVATLGATRSDAQQSLLYAEGPYGPTLQLSAAEQRVVQRRHGRNVRACPDKYLFVNTHTYGRHHNQLQEMMHLIAWAERLGRTAVLGWFRFSHRWVPTGELYNVTRIKASYCVVTPEEMIQRIGSRNEAPSAACLGQKMDDTPLKKLLKGNARMKCRLDPSVPAHYNTRQGMRITREYVATHVSKAQETLLVLSGQLAFFLRPGLAESAALFGLLEPAGNIRTIMAAFQRKYFGGNEAPPNYFGIHLRRREEECLKEIHESKEDGSQTLLKDMGDVEWRIVSTQCAITVPHVKALMSSLRLLIDHQPMFLGSDHQDMKVEKALVDHGAVMFSDASGLIALAVDYFMLSEGKYFTGNQLSSITQNVCYRRLGRGLGCHGFIPSFTRYHSRNVETDKSFIRSFGVGNGPEEEEEGKPS